MRQTIGLLALGAHLLVAIPAAAQATTFVELPLGTLTLRAGKDYQGKIVAGKRWTDKSGENIVILTDGGVVKRRLKGSPDDEVQDGTIFAYQFQRVGTRHRLLWTVRDFVKDCSTDLTLRFLPAAFVLSDANGDGVAESTFIYRLGCRSDVSPLGQKLIMHEGRAKYAIRGTTTFRGALVGRAPEINTGGGKKVLDPAFGRAPRALRTFASAHWDRHAFEDTGS
jgi:hypothetical protein